MHHPLVTPAAAQRAAPAKGSAMAATTPSSDSGRTGASCRWRLTPRRRREELRLVNDVTLAFALAKARGVVKTAWEGRGPVPPRGTLLPKWSFHPSRAAAVTAAPWYSCNRVFAMSAVIAVRWEGSMVPLAPAVATLRGSEHDLDAVGPVPNATLPPSTPAHMRRCRDKSCKVAPDVACDP